MYLAKSSKLASIPKFRKTSNQDCASETTQASNYLLQIGMKKPFLSISSWNIFAFTQGHLLIAIARDLQMCLTRKINSAQEHTFSLFLFWEGNRWYAHENRKWQRSSWWIREAIYNFWVFAPHHSSSSIMSFNCPLWGPIAANYSSILKKMAPKCIILKAEDWGGKWRGASLYRCSTMPPPLWSGNISLSSTSSHCYATPQIELHFRRKQRAKLRGKGEHNHISLNIHPSACPACHTGCTESTAWIEWLI